MWTFALSALGSALSVVSLLVGYLLRLALADRDKRITDLEANMRRLEDRLHEQELKHVELSGKLDTVIELLQRVESKLEKL
jgi:hypothetical protein